MKVIVWRTGPKGSVMPILGAVLTASLAHICCWGPILLTPLGFGGASYLLGNLLDSFKPYIYIIPVLMLVIAGRRLYKKPGSHLIEKVVYCISALLVITILFL